MKTWKAMGQDAKNKRRAKPSGKVRPHKSKKKKPFRLEHRYVGKDRNIGSMFWGTDWYDREWHNYYNKYATIKAAQSSADTLNKQERNEFEYRVKK